MDDAPELLPLPEELPLTPEPPEISSGSLWRDSLLDLIAALGIGGIVIVLVAALLLFLSLDPGELLSSGWGIAALLLSTQLPLLYRALRRRRRNRQKQRTVPTLFENTTASAIFQGMGTGLGLAILSGIYTSIVMKLMGPDSVESQIDFLKDMLQDHVAVAFLVFLIAGVAPVCEEIFFRGVVFGSARAAGKPTTGLIITAVLFAFVHLIPILAPFYAFFAIVMCWLYNRTGTLASSIAAHMTMNALACAGLLMQGDGIV